jgi:hypothetical protein
MWRRRSEKVALVPRPIEPQIHPVLAEAAIEGAAVPIPRVGDVDPLLTTVIVVGQGRVRDVSLQEQTFRLRSVSVREAAATEAIRKMAAQE